MAQIRTGLAIVVQGVNTVSGYGTDWIGKVKTGNTFKIAGQSVFYTITDVSTTTQQITLDRAFTGESASNLNYIIESDFTPTFHIPLINTGDMDWPYILSEALRKIDSILASLSQGTALDVNWDALGVYVGTTPPTTIVSYDVWKQTKTGYWAFWDITPTP